MTMPRTLPRQLAPNESGVAAMEFAFIAPVFIFMTFSALDFGYIQLAQSELQGATQIAARSIIQSSAGTTAERKAAIISKVNNFMDEFHLADSTTMTVDLRKFSSFGGMRPEPFTDDTPGDDPVSTDGNGTWDAGEPYTDRNANGQWDADDGIANELGGVGDVVRIEVTYPLKPLVSYSTSLFGVNGRLDLKATAVMRNEPE